MSTDTARTRFQLFYSIVLLIVIPGILILNTFWWVHQSKIDNEILLQEKTTLLATTFASSVINELDSPAQVKAAVDSIVAQQPEVTELTVFKLDGDYLIPIASSRTERMENWLSDLSTIPAWQQKKPMFNFGGDYIGDTLHKIGSIQYPLLDGTHSAVGLINATVSFASFDQRSEETFNRSVLILFSAVVLIVLLLANHFRMIESTVLLQKLKEVDHMKDDFISMASHELRTPLTAIKGFASMLLEGAGGSLNDKGKHYVEIIMHSTGGLESLVGDMLDVSRIEQGRMVFDIKQVDLGSLTQNIVDQLQIPAEGKGLHLEHIKPEGPILVQADQTRTRQVLFNLIGNAIKYTEKGSVNVSYADSPEGISLVIQDTGIGMTEDDRKKLFAKFYRIRNEKTEKITGTGLGLWITKQLIDKMGGTITVESEVGVGSRFIVTLPRSS